ncbi:dioxygenase [Pseudenhygromyxa sp. WMMC2535]|nr:dioxygenase [Pseudenhygromyxa sp. WMMC2535]
MHETSSKDRFTRRELIAGVAVAAGGVGVAATLLEGASASGEAGAGEAGGAGEGRAAAADPSEKTGGAGPRQPAIFVPHGGGPWPFVELPGFISSRDVEVLRGYFEALPGQLPAPPRALLVISAHWEARVPTIMTASAPPILYDYGGFPPESYEIQWPAPGDPQLAKRVGELLSAAGVPYAEDSRRGFDHGTFIPFKVSWPAADVPTIQVSLQAGLDPKTHIALGRALAPLRDEGVLILGSGMSYHNMRGFFSGRGRPASITFDEWLRDAATKPGRERERLLAEWSAAPSARDAHPREEHLLPLMVVAGAAHDDTGRVTFNDDWMGTRISAIQYG